MGKPLSAAHKAAISRALKNRNGGGSHKLGGEKLGGAKLSAPKSKKAETLAPATKADAPVDRNARRRERRVERNAVKSAGAAELQAKQAEQVLKGIRTRGSGTFSRKEVQSALDISPRDFNRALKTLQESGAISASQRRISMA